MKPTNEAIAQRAYELWEKSNGDHGHHHEHWLEAERQLSSAGGTVENQKPSQSPRADSANGNASSPHAGSGSSNGEHAVKHPSHVAPIPHLNEVKAAQQKHDARAPQVPTKNAPKIAPPQSGKPVWDKPHSS